MILGIFSEERVLFRQPSSFFFRLRAFGFHACVPRFLVDANSFFLCSLSFESRLLFELALLFFKCLAFGFDASYSSVFFSAYSRLFFGQSRLLRGVFRVVSRRRLFDWTSELRWGLFVRFALGVQIRIEQETIGVNVTAW